ncbi:MAG: hypothetical protein V3W31_08480, partial [Thermodesulfobacteriota bacterium]
TIPLAKLGEGGGTTGVEGSREAVRFARENAAVGGVDSARFVCQPVEGAVLGKILERESPAVVVLDPPRGGGLDAVKSLAAAGPRRIIYVSCSPPTLARDVSFLLKHGYKPFSAGVVDMFPQTYHIEGVVGLDLVK